MVLSRQWIEELIQAKGDVQPKPPGLIKEEVTEALVYSRSLDDLALEKLVINVRDAYIARQFFDSLKWKAQKAF